MADASARNLSAALAELDRLAQQRPALREPCQALAAVLPVLFTRPATEKPMDLAADTVAARLAEGRPLLRGAQPALDVPALRQRWAGVCAALRQPGATALAEAVRGGRLDPVALLQALLDGQPDAVAAQAEAVGGDGALTATVLRFAALPALASLTRHLGQSRQGLDWGRGYCPVCGSWPVLGETRGLEQDRFLRCGWCAAAWAFERLRCPFCDNRDHHTLGYVHVEGEENRHRAGTCDACHGYVKWVSTIFSLTEPQLLVADVATLHLDLAAAERGFYVA